MSIEQELIKSWHENYEPLWNTEARLSKAEFQIPGEPRLVLVHNSLRDYYEKNKKKEAEERQIGGGKCVLDDEPRVRSKTIPYETLFFRINAKPSLKFHLFIQPLEHREYPLASDHKTIMDFVSETNFAVYQNLRGSGAGFPDHVHYQGQLRENFPLLTDYLYEPSAEITNDRFDLIYPQMLNFGALFKMKSQKARDVVSYLIQEIGEELVNEGIFYNLIFSKNKVFLFPRTKEIAQNIPQELRELGMDQWQIAGQEMGYLFSAKCLPIFQRLSWQTLVDISRETTVVDTSQQQNLKDLINRRCK